MHKKFGIVFTTILLLFPLSIRAAAGDSTAHDIMEKNFFVIKIKNIKQEAIMTLVDDKGRTRERKMDLMGKLQDNKVDYNLIIRFHYPADIKGTSFLQIEHSDGDDNLWIYLPALKKSRRLVANNKKDSFFGSDFSYSDILPLKVDLYEHKLIKLEPVEGFDCYVIESTPKDLKEMDNNGYAKKISWIRKDNFVESKIEYYDVKGRLLKTQTISRHKEVDPENHRWMALQREMVNHQTVHKTVLTFDKVNVGTAIADDVFTTSTLEREWRR
jgi:hypothetical protein